MIRFCAIATSICLCTAPLGAQEFTTLKGHGGPIMGLAVTEEGRVVSASFDNSVGLWDGSKAAWLEAHEAAVNVALPLPDGRLASGGDDFSVLLWNEGNAKELGRHRGKVTALALSPDGRTLASASWDGTAALWPIGGSEPRILTPRDSGVNDVVFAPSGTHVFLATTRGEVLAYDLRSNDAPEPLVQHGFGVNRVMISPDGSWLAYGAVDGGTRVVDTATGEPIADFTLDRKPILSLAYHAETAQLAVGDGHGYIMVINTHRWKIAKDFRAMRRGPVWALAFSSDGGMIYAGGLDDVVYGWPVSLLDDFDPVGGEERSFLKDADQMGNGERQFMRKCSICHALEEDGGRKAGPTLFALFGRRAGTTAGYRYSETLKGSDIVWTEDTIDRLFELGPDRFIPGSKMPMQVIARDEDRRDLITFLKTPSHELEK